MVRYSSPIDYFLATYENSQVRLYRRSASGFTQIGQANVHEAVGSTHSMQVRLDGPGIQVWWDGEHKIQGVESSNLTATRHGVYWNVQSDPASRIDEFSFYGGEISVPVTVVATPARRTLPVGDGHWLSARAYADANVWIPWTSFTWHSSNSSVATVQSNGLATALLTAVSSGTTTITATSTEGLSATIRVLVTVEENPAGVQVYDSFSEGGGLSISTRVPDVNVDGNTWVVRGSPNIGLFNGRIRATNNGSLVFGTVDSGTPNGTVSVIWRPVLGSSTPQPNGGVVFRYVNETSYWYAQYWERNLYLMRVTPAGHVQVAVDGVMNAVNATHQLALILDGPRIQVWWDGILRIEVTDSMNETATRHGVLWHSQTDAGSWMDDFSVNVDFITPVRPPQPPEPCINGVWPPSRASWPTAGGTDTVTLSAAGCAWEARSTVPWIQVTTPSGFGDAFVEYSVEPNTSGERFGAIVFENSDWTVPDLPSPWRNINDDLPGP